MLIMLVPTMISFLMGMYCVHTGKPIVPNNFPMTAFDCFVFSGMASTTAWSNYGSGGSISRMGSWLGDRSIQELYPHLNKCIALP